MHHLKVELFDGESHAPGLVQALLRLRGAGSIYPPVQDAGGTEGSMAAWLMEGGDFARFVITHRGTPVGHATMGPAHQYLVNHLEAVGHAPVAGCRMAEIGKFFVDPQSAGQGAGSMLLQAVLAEAWAEGMQPALAALAGSEVAMRLYERVGMNAAGSFGGIHGTNFVFVDPGPVRR